MNMLSKVRNSIQPFKEGAAMNQKHLETGTDTEESPKQWGLHNGVVVLAALGLLVLALFLNLIRPTELFAGMPLWADGVVSQVRYALILAAGTVIGMLVATRMLQVHVGSRGAKMLALWGIVAMVLSASLHSALFVFNLYLQDAGLPLMFAFLSISELVTGSMAIGASMLALAFVGRIDGVRR